MTAVAGRSPRHECVHDPEPVPYNSGHSMVVPNEHISEAEDLPAATRDEMFALASVLRHPAERSAATDSTSA